MVAFDELLAGSLERATAAAHDQIVQSGELSRTDRERLVRSGWLTPVIRGWYLLGHPEGRGETTRWHASYWTFMARYLAKRFGAEYCLSAESSLDFHLDRNTIPKQLVVIAGKGGSSRVDLPHETSLFTWQGDLPPSIQTRHGIQVMSLPLALCRVAPALFVHDPVKAEIALRLVAPADIARILIDGGHTHVASRLIGAYRFLGDEAAAETIAGNLSALGYRVREENPFESGPPLFGTGSMRLKSPYAARIEAMWKQMREGVLSHFPGAPGMAHDPSAYLKTVEDLYKHDAYHSLSIEGYQVTPELIEQIRTGQWNPDAIQADTDQRNVMAAKGYQSAFSAVCDSIKKLFKGMQPGKVVEQDIHHWYQALFLPSVQTGLIKAADLVGYRNDQVYLRGAAHVPPPSGALLDSMEALFECLKEEPEPAVRAVLGHFIFVFIHPYMDGNGRIGRFLMNLMLASGGYRWTVIRSDRPRRDKYMQALEQASTEQNIVDFSEFIAEEMAVDWAVVYSVL